MTGRKSLKQQITEAVLKEIPRQYTGDHELTIDEVIFKWWMTGRQEGLRLTDDGVVAFQLAEIEYYEHKIEKSMLAPTKTGQSWHSFILDVNKKIKCPYYLGVNKKDKQRAPYIRFYDSKIAMMVELYGDLQTYLDSIRVRE